MNLFPLAGLNVVVIIVLVIAGLVLAVIGWERYRPSRRPVHPMPTSEVFVDPETQKRLRVWVDPVTGARDYREDDPRTTALPPLERPGLHLPNVTPQPLLPPPAEPPPADDGDRD